MREATPGFPGRGCSPLPPSFPTYLIMSVNHVHKEVLMLSFSISSLSFFHMMGRNDDAHTKNDVPLAINRGT